MNSAEEDDQHLLPTVPNVPIEFSNAYINDYISRDQTITCINNLKNSKACGEDKIINEYIKNTSDIFITYMKNFSDK